jgi:metal-responsive CopG/Arc/MetJ family transcriptional regulator|nr:ribbon-helix-helix protein, CopG family [Gloeotrichia echinulata DEX184]
MVKKKHGKYDEPKMRVSIALTASSVEALDKMATEMNISRSEIVEIFARSSQQVQQPPANEKAILGESIAS